MLRSLTDALAPALGANLKIQIETLDAVSETVADQLRRDNSRRQAQAEASIADDPAVKQLVNQFDARVVPQSTRPNQSE